MRLRICNNIKIKAKLYDSMQYEDISPCSIRGYWSIALYCSACALLCAILMLVGGRDRKCRVFPVFFKVFFRFFGLFRFVTKQFCLFRLFRYRFETPKQTEIFSFWFHETNRNKREPDLVSVCFGSNRNLFLFVSRTP